MDQQEKVRDAGSSLVSQMTEVAPVPADRASHLTLLNSYLLPEMARRLETPGLGWHWHYQFVRLLGLCIDREGGVSNKYLLASLLNHRVLTLLPPIYRQYMLAKPYRIAFLQLVSALLSLKEEIIVDQLVADGYLFLVWEGLLEGLRRKTLLYSVCLRIFADLHTTGVPQYVRYFGDNLAEMVRAKGLNMLSPLGKLLDLHSRSLGVNGLQGDFSRSSSEAVEHNLATIAKETLVDNGVNSLRETDNQSQTIRQSMDEILGEDSSGKATSFIIGAGPLTKRPPEWP